MRIVTYNVEWFNALFDEEGQLREDDGPSARYGVSRREQLAALGIVFTALDADAVMVIEAPDANRHRDHRCRFRYRLVECNDRVDLKVSTLFALESEVEIVDFGWIETWIQLNNVARQQSDDPFPTGLDLLEEPHSRSLPVV